MPDAYRIVYRIENRAGDELVTSTERVWVRRPFDSRVEAWTGPPPGRRQTSTTINAFARLRTGEAVFAVGPAPVPLDHRVDGSLDEVVRRGYAEARERRRVAGRTCRIYRIGGEGGSGGLVRRGDGDDFTDLCIDEAGLAVEEVTFTEGKILTRRVAVEVDENARLSDRLFRAGDPTLTARQGGGSVREVEPSSRPPGTFWELSEEPERFERRGRYTVVPPQAGFDDPTQRSGIITFTTDVWERGVDVLVIEQGATLGGRDPFADDPNAQRVRVGDLGRGELIYSFRASEVRVRMKGGKFVRVVGTVGPSRLLAIARSLEEQPGGELVFLDEPPG